MIYGVILPLLVAVAPWYVVRYIFPSPTSRKVTYRMAAPYLWSAAAFWEIGIRMPAISIGVQTDTFGLHTMGGIAACILYFFVVRAYQLHFSEVWQKPLFLYFFVSGLGVANELFELFIDQTHILIVSMHPHDTWWDLTANTFGATLAFIVASLYLRYRSVKQR